MPIFNKEPNYAIFFYKMGVRKIEFVIQKKNFLRLSFKKNKKDILWKLKQKVCGRQKAFLDKCKALSIRDSFRQFQEINLIENNELVKSGLEATEV